MFQVDVYLRVRRGVMVEGVSIREAARVFGLHRDTVRNRILEDDFRVPRKQRHTAKRIYERLRDEYEFEGQYTIVWERLECGLRSSGFWT